MPYKFDRIEWCIEVSQSLELKKELIDFKKYQASYSCKEFISGLDYVLDLCGFEDTLIAWEIEHQISLIENI